MTPPARRADAQRNRERLLTAAAAALDERGVNASLDDIAKVAGVGNATLYRHFSSREKLIEAVYDQRILRLCESAGEIGAARPPGAALVAWLREVVAHITESRLLSEAFMAGYDGPADTEPPQVVAWHHAIYEAAEPLLRAAQRAGAIRHDLDPAELLALTTAVARAGQPSQAGHFLDVLLDGVVPRAVDAPPP
ncbi:TetR/AcrR family transcriptional regulator [Nocardia bovistercoris]|uniref:TetR/AcrR family transcriptional regulator n=1 Tax=Nocardia bovistercoris TaxID=2785916 RepID=A0A931IFK9_9NOCA|nr:TetR/AcrR family transcriptional regulator [Nocardia bovistercoris]MBH0779536.1 TetR/AcrR family transcriptional regulator [Nocardia bovistercoris]